MEDTIQPDRSEAPGVASMAATGAGSDATNGGDLPRGPTFFGADLGQVLVEALQGRLSDLSWFRTDWQRGGSLTGYATYRDDQGASHPVVVKLPVPPQERTWLVRLQEFSDVVPRLYAHGMELGQYDIAWVVMERLWHGPLGHAWESREFDLLVEAAGRFYSAAATFPVSGEPPRRDYEKILHQTRQNIREHDVAHEQRWANAIKKAHRKLKDWLAVWNRRPVDHWCHGDLHLGNAMTRVPPPGGPALLFDFAQIHPGHWIEDAVYLEHLFWARRARLGGRKICKQIAHERKVRGLRVDDNWPQLASIRRALMALSTPAMLEHDGDPHHVEAALHILEIEVGSG